MSIVAKTLLMLVFLIAYLSLGVTATLYVQRVDWPEKMSKKIGDMITQESSYKAEIKAIQDERGRLTKAEKELANEIQALKEQARTKDAEIARLYKVLDEQTLALNRINSDLEVMLQQLLVEAEELRKYALKVEELRNKVAQAAAERQTALYRALTYMQEVEILQKRLAATEEKYTTLVRNHKELYDRIKYLETKYPINPNLGLKAIEAEVKSCDTGGNIMLISAGKEHGVKEGDLFIIMRGSLSIAHAKAVVVHQKESTCYVLKVFDVKEYPKPGDVAVRK